MRLSYPLPSGRCPPPWTACAPTAPVPRRWRPSRGAWSSSRPGRAPGCCPAMSSTPIDAPPRPRGPARGDGAGPRRRHQAQRRPGDEHGPARAQVADRGQAGPHVPRRHRPPDRESRRPAARADELGRRAGSSGVRDFLPGPRAAAVGRHRTSPSTWPADPALEWCPAGHGDVYVALEESGMLAHAARRGRRLGVHLQRRQPRRDRRRADPGVGRRARRAVRDGGRARHGRRPQGRAPRRCTTGAWCCARPRRCPTATTRSPTSTAGASTTPTTSGSTCARSDPGALDLPLIVNRKPVDPRDPARPEVLQLETAMGAAVGAIDGARAIEVPRSRFAPVKTTDDLLLVRSDAYALGDDGTLAPCFAGDPPVVTLGPALRRLRRLRRALRRRPAVAARSRRLHRRAPRSAPGA